MEGQNHTSSENSHITSEGSSSEASSKKSLSSHHSSSPSKHSSSDGAVKNHHSKPKVHSSSNSIKHKDGAVKPKDPNKHASSKPKDQKHREHSSKSRDHHKDPSAKPRESNSKPSSDQNNKVSSHAKDPSQKHKDPSVKHKDPSSKPRDPNAKPRDPNAKPRDPNAKPRDPNAKPRDPNAKPRDPNAKPRDPNAKPRDSSIKQKDHSQKPRDPNLKPKDPSLKNKDPNAKPRDPNLKSKDPSAKPRDPSAKPKDSTGDKHRDRKPELSSPKPTDPSKAKDPSKKLKEGYVRMKDGTIRKKSSSSKDPSRHSSSGSSSKPAEKSHSGDTKPIRKEKATDGTKGDSGREGHNRVIRKEGDSTAVKQERSASPVKIKKENGAVRTPSPVKAVKPEPESDEEDEKPLNQRLQEKRPLEDSEDDEPLTNRIEKVKKKRKSESDDEFVPEKAKKRKKEPEDEDFDEKPLKKKKKKDDNKKKKKDKDVKAKDGKPTKKKKKEEEAEVWKWWEEEPLPEGVRWRSLEHKGPVFAPPYERLPKKIKFHYAGEHIVLSEEAEEVAGFYARMLDHEYTTKEIFNTNFFRDWRKSMTKEEQATITDLKKCDFTRMHKYFLEQAELRKNRTKEEKQALKESNEKVMEEYGFCIIDGHKEKIGNFKIEPPGLFRGRGDHPKMGKLKKRIQPEQVTINCSKDSVIAKPPDGHKWKAVTHDDSVTWLVSWTENIQGSNKYIMLNPSSRLKGEKDWMKYETARKLKKSVDRIRDDYREDWKSKEMRIRQRAVALYFIDKLALRAGNEKEEGETADTVGCCSLRVEHIKLHEQDGDQEFVVEFDFLGKDSIRYQNKVAVEKRVFKNLQLFVENKQGDDDLFDRINTTILNKYLQDLMPGLTAKVFRTYNASITLQNQLKALTVPEDGIPSKILSYNRANRAVAVLCNHQRAAPKTFDKQMANLKEKVKAKITAIKDAKKDFKSVKQEYKKSGNDKMKALVERKKKAVDRLEEQLSKLEMQATDKEENKEIALGTSKLNYLDPRISVAWCKKWEVPMEKVYNRTQRDKFRWAIDMVGEDYVF